MNRRDINIVEYRGRCEDCGKLRWASRAAARKFAKQNHPGERIRAYQCGDFWHLGHPPRGGAA